MITSDLVTIDAQIAYLNREVRCTIRPSPVHGIGVFALRDVKKGEKLYCETISKPAWLTIPYERFNEIRPEVRELILQRWPRVATEKDPFFYGFMSPNEDQRLLSFMNHSSTPNYGPTAKYTGDRALRDIQTGEEITEDYGEFALW